MDLHDGLPMRTSLVFKPLVFLASLVPATYLAMAGYLDQLGANPIEKVLRESGFWTLSFLLLCLSVTPLRQFSGVSWIGQFRRMLGLFAFFYACLHMLTYIGLDQFFDWPQILKDVAKHPYVMVGLTGYLLLIPLALTSTSGMMKRMGGRRWKTLHQAVYFIAVLGVIHYWWLVKKDILKPSLFAAGLVALMTFRLIQRLKRT